LGDHFRSQGIEFSAAYSGSLSRQRATAAEIHPDVTVDPGFDEFDLSHVYRELSPCLIADDAEFRIEYLAMQKEIAESAGAHDSPVHRKWNGCDKKCVRAWIDGRYPYSGESWGDFVARVQAALTRVTSHEGNVVVFTSATPIGIAAAQTLEISDGRAMWLAAVMFNSAFTTLRVHNGEIQLFTLNAIPHLGEPSLRTFR
jgi:broad specificity phosphatase PhoE